MTTRAWAENFEIDDHTHRPINDGDTVPVGTTVSYNIWAHIDPEDAATVEVVHEKIKGPGKEGWNGRTANDGPFSIKALGDAVIGVDFWARRTYQPLDKPGDYYFYFNCFSHQDGVTGETTEIEVHVV